MSEETRYRSAIADAIGRPVFLEDGLKIWLDDDLETRRAPEGWVHVRTAREACFLLRTPEVRRRRRSDPNYPSSWYLWMSEKGKAYVRAWGRYSWGLSKRPKPWGEFKEERAPTRRRLNFRPGSR